MSLASCVMHWSNLKRRKRETVPVSKGLRMVWLVAARATGDCDLKPSASDAGSFSRVTDRTEQSGCCPHCRYYPVNAVVLLCSLPRAGPGPLPASDSKPLFTESVRSPTAGRLRLQGRPDSTLLTAPVPAQVQAGKPGFPSRVNNSLFFLSSILASGLSCGEGFLGVKV